MQPWEKIVIVVLVDLIVYVKKERKGNSRRMQLLWQRVTPVGGDTARHGGSLRSTVLLDFFPNHPEFST